jgi:RNA polymerase sigma factor (sigma-70 family)
MTSDQEIIEGCARHERKAQRLLYQKYSRKLMGMCLRYAANRAEAEDILQESFIKIFFAIRNFSGSGSFEGWLKKITVNTAITYYHSNQKFRHYTEIGEYTGSEPENNGFDESQFTAEELMNVLNELPAGYRIVFNLYAIEGYMHKEIADMLGIDAGTSKSQYSRARAVIREKLVKLDRTKGRYRY